MVMDLLKIQNLSVRLKSQQILHQLSFEMKKGNITALMGPNGAGKSTCMKVLAGLIEPQSGSYEFNQMPQKDFKALRQFGGYLIESPAFYPYLTAHQNLELLQKIRKAKRTTHELLQIVGLGDTGSKKVAQFSKGMKQRLGMAQALIGDPDFLVLDEPFHGLDIEVKQELILLIHHLAKKEGKSILISSHLLSDLESLADDFVLLHHGKIHYAGSVHHSSESKFQLTFSFTDPIVDELMIKLDLKGVSHHTETTLCLAMKESESKGLLKQMIEHGYFPIKMDTQSTLTQKYMEITK